LHGANLRYADLQNADLQNANLQNADLYNANLRNANLCNTGILTFQYQQHRAICNGVSIQIGCETHSIEKWLDNYEVIGELSGYNQNQIDKYGEFILMCAKEYL
jgi:hypothetical protein